MESSISFRSGEGFSSFLRFMDNIDIYMMLVFYYYDYHVRKEERYLIFDICQKISDVYSLFRFFSSVMPKS